MSGIDTTLGSGRCYDAFPARAVWSTVFRSNYVDVGRAALSALGELKVFCLVEMKRLRSPPRSIGVQIAHDSCLHEANERALQLTRKPVRGLKNVCKVSSSDTPFARCKVPAPEGINIIGAAATVRRFGQRVRAEHVGDARPLLSNVDLLGSANLPLDEVHSFGDFHELDNARWMAGQIHEVVLRSPV